MPSSNLISHAPHEPAAVDPLPNASNLILIDNYDSFTWNVYQYLVLEGATVAVYRNDQISLEQLIALQPTQLVVSPGPGHPDTDAGISKEAIKHFAGRIPVLGVCMGEQCIYSVFGGDVVFAGEILHGKTSPLQHDRQGIYANLHQDLPVTRYHSLAGTHPTLPDCLEVSAWSPVGVDGSHSVIMGVRHKEFVIEGVQFHPESILTAHGRTMLKNFLKMRGGTWAENSKFLADSNNVKRGQLETSVETFSPNNVNGNTRKSNGGEDETSEKKSILDRIYDHRKLAVAAQMDTPSQRPSDLQAAYQMDLAPPLISFVDRIKQSPFSLSLMAEIKRASPSKGIISLSACAPTQAREYALSGASVISVLTEPEWFKGSIDDLRLVRQAIEAMPNRPAVLRKEFIFNEYQILEARLAGADTILLIVKMLDLEALEKLYHYSISLGMDPLVEVNTVEEMTIAVGLGAKVIGVNNRNLTTFEVDLDTTSRLLSYVPKEVTVCALSGISGREDVATYQQNGVGAVLVGESLMRASDTATFISDLLGRPKDPNPDDAQEMLVKICGTRTPEAAKVAVNAGADLIGIILVDGRRRCVSQQLALEISNTVHETKRNNTTSKMLHIDASKSSFASDYFSHHARVFRHPNRALLVGVFQDQPLSHILAQQRLLDLDVIQLHGSEPLEWASLIPVPVIHSFKPGQPGLLRRGYHALPLLDSGTGGSGTTLDHDSVMTSARQDAGFKTLLAGGLSPENVRDVLRRLGPASLSIVGVDVSSGVEDKDGDQDHNLIAAFVKAAKAPLT
ncbi:MAG: bifunctional tryptophan synthase trp1 [Piccolia ochrophora]|nr:MAG: bifunctional tryptophan synthase trp1 [Piccolia ochrophora]